MAGGTILPGAGMRSRIDGKIVTIMGQETGRGPAGVNGVTACTVMCEASSLVVRGLSIFKILLMTSITICRRHGKITSGMAGCTIVDFMALLKGEKAVVHHIGLPIGRFRAMAFQAVG